MFQDDIYPDTSSGEPSLNCDEWFSGHNASPILLKMESLYNCVQGTRQFKGKPFSPSASVGILDNQSRADSPPRPIVTATPGRTASASEVNKIPDEQTAKSQLKAEQVLNPSQPPEAYPPIVDEASSMSAENVLRRLLGLVEEQSKTLHAQEKRLLSLEARYAQYDQVFANLEAKLETLTQHIFQAAETGTSNIHEKPALEL